MSVTIYECDSCGLCCRELIIEVLREPRIADVGKRLSGPNRSLPILESEWSLAVAKKCPFLSKSNRCGIYASRPDVCVSFQAGSPKCQQLRRQAGLKPLNRVKRKTTDVNEILAALAELEGQDDEG